VFYVLIGLNPNLTLTQTVTECRKTTLDKIADYRCNIVITPVTHQKNSLPGI